ncbi:hypothetical protein [Nitrososphaera sp.]
MVKDRNFLANMENYIKANNDAASYFLELDGDKTVVFIMDVSGVDRYRQ